MSRIIVKNLPEQITKEKLKQVFGESGVVTDIQLKFTKNGKFRRFAFIGFQKPEMAEAAKQYLNKSFINTSQIQIETCAELGDPNKPRPWSKYAPENCKQKKKKLEKAGHKKEKVVKIEKQKIKDSHVLELLKLHKNDKLFTEFMEVNMQELPSELKVNNEELGVKEKLDKETDINEEEKMEDEKNILANKDISDAEYIKLKTGVELNLNDNRERIYKKDIRYKQLFTVKLSGLPLKVKKSQIKEFLSPIKPYTIRRALKIKGIAYCGFLTENEMKKAVFKHRSFLNNKRIFVVPVEAKKSQRNKEIEAKWESESERLKSTESIAESGKIFVRNLSYTATEDDLKEKFEIFGPVVDLSMPIDSFTRKPKGFAFVTFLMPEHACKAFSELDGTIFQGRMLHLLPSLPQKNTEEEEENNSDDTFKKKKLKKEKEKSSSSVNWNTYFIGENALAEAMAATYNTSKENVLSDKQGNAAVRLALGETQLTNKMKQFLEENDVCLEAFENMSICPRSKTVILVKNLPFGTKPGEIRDKFAPFGVLKRVVLPPTGVAALVEFVEPSEAKVAFRRVSYSKFKHVPMYLEWAPEKIFNDKNKLNGRKDDKEETGSTAPQEAANKSETERVENAANVEVHIPVEGATVFVKNLNFSTGKAALIQHFSPCGTIVSANIAQKKNPNEPGKKLSMGYGFVEFADKESADKALKTLQFSSLDDHRIELKRSNRTLAPSTLSGRITSKNNEKPSTKILVRNVPFQATPKEISDLFKVFGEIKAVRMPKKMVGTGSHRGFCFIEFNTVQEAKRAFAAVSQSTHLYGRRLVLEWAAAADDDIATLREKTAQQFKAGISGIGQKTKIAVEEDSEEE